MTMNLVLDIDETLIHSSDDPFPDGPADFMAFKYHVRHRPYLYEFMNFATSNFRVSLWSSGSDDYVDYVSKTIWNPKELHFIWGSSKCTRSTLSSTLWDESRTVPTKKLSKLEKTFGYDLNRTIIVDDTPEKCRYNYGNAVYAEEFEGDRSDTFLPALAAYLKHLKDQVDSGVSVRDIEKRGWYRRWQGNGFP